MILTLHFSQTCRGDTDFEDFQELQSPVIAFGVRNIPEDNIAVPKTHVADFRSQREEFVAPIDLSPTDDTVLDLILVDREQEKEKEECNSSTNPNPNISDMSLAFRTAPAPPHLILQDSNKLSPTTSPAPISPIATLNSAEKHQHVAGVCNKEKTSLLQPSIYGSTATIPTLRTTSLESLEIKNKPLPKEPPQQQPKSPGSFKLASFFGWASTTGSPSTTEFSDQELSPLPSHFSPKPSAFFDDSTVSPRPPKTTAATETSDNITTTPLAGSTINYHEGYSQTPTPQNPSLSLAQIDTMEDELKAIGAELAASIRREIDLEDLVDRLQTEINNPQLPGKRTSDYFSDSGISSAKFSEYDQSREEVEKVQRRAEQEKAQLRLDLMTKLQDEREKRKDLDWQIQALANKASQIDMAQTSNANDNGRLQDLEMTCDDLRRRLSEEKQVKENFEDLLAVLKDELHNMANERDNLRDEIVPQLRARVEGLETQAAENEKLAYEASKMQQELSSLKADHLNLTKAPHHDTIGSPTSPRPTRKSLGKLRFNSVNATPSPALPVALPPAAFLSPSASVKSPGSESRDALADRLKDVQAQRDALHNSLKSLLDRQEFQSRENEKKIRQLELERDRLLTSSPRKANYEREVSNLRGEINVLRRRAEDAVEQRLQVEKRLEGLKMDLDRAEQEIAALRTLLLKESDNLMPETLPQASDTSEYAGAFVESAALDKAYKDLQVQYARALERIKSLQIPSRNQNEKTSLALLRVQQSLANAISDRDVALSEVKSLQSQVKSLRGEEEAHLASEADLHVQLTAASKRIEELAAQVSSQLASNADLRNRLSERVARGNATQKLDAARITQMQARLKELEDQLVAAQTAAEECVARHEKEVTLMREGLAKPGLVRHSSASNLGVRINASPLGPRSPSRVTMGPSRSPRSPMFASPRSPKMQLSPPRPGRARSLSWGRADSMASDGDSDDTERSAARQVEALKVRVAELETALAGAEAEMQEIVSRVSKAQIEVLKLEEERDAAIRETKHLQRELEKEKKGAFEERFRMLTEAAEVTTRSEA